MNKAPPGSRHESLGVLRSSVRLPARATAVEIRYAGFVSQGRDCRTQLLDLAVLPWPLRDAMGQDARCLHIAWPQSPAEAFEFPRVVNNMLTFRTGDAFVFVAQVLHSDSL